jgi:hypothetical protein
LVSAIILFSVKIVSFSIKSQVDDDVGYWHETAGFLKLNYWGYIYVSAFLPFCRYWQDSTGIKVIDFLRFISMNLLTADAWVSRYWENLN